MPTLLLHSAGCTTGSGDVVLPEDYDAWLGPTSSPEDLRKLLLPYDESVMVAYAVSRKFNSAKNDTEECIESIGVFDLELGPG